MTPDYADRSRVTGMHTVIALRKNGLKPAAVVVDLVHTIGKYDAEKFAFNESSGIVSVNIAAAESLNDIDFRPLVGLQVFVHDNTGNRARHRRVCALIANSEAEHLVMPVWDGVDVTVHQRWSGTPPRSESYSA